MFSRQEDYIRNMEFRLLSTCMLLKMYFEKIILHNYKIDYEININNNNNDNVR